MYVCDYCGTQHRYPISAALCCDIISNELSDDDFTGITLSTN